MIVAAAIDALNARDKEMVDALFDDAVEWRPALSAGGTVGNTLYRGKQGMIEYLEGVDARLDGMRVDVVGIHPLERDQVLYRARVTAREGAGGIPLDVSVWGLWQVRDGKLIRGAAFLSEEEALEAAGVKE